MQLIGKIALTAMLILLSSGFLLAQENTVEEEKKENPKKERPVRNPFESSVLLEHQTIVNPKAKTLVLNMQHRFGNLRSGNGFDLLGLYGVSNIRIGFDYAIWNNLQVGFGTTKNNRVQDFSAKWSILQQRKKGMPLFLTVFSSIGIEAREKENYEKVAHRFSYYNEMMIARKFHKHFTLQMSLAYSHFNVVDNSVAFTFEESGSEVRHDMRHDNFAIGTLARVKITSQTSIIMGYDQPLASPTQDRLIPNLSFGGEIATSSHSFQIFISNYNGILGQYNLVRNTNEIGNGDFLIGFNITRLWGF